MRPSPARPQRTIDLLRPHLDGITHALDLHPGDPDLRDVLGLPPAIAYVPSGSDLDPPSEGRLLVTRLPAGEPADVLADDLAAADPGGRAVVLLLAPLEAAPVLAAGDVLAAAGWQVAAFGELVYDTARSALVAVRTDDGEELVEHNRRVVERALVPALLARFEADDSGADDAGHLRDRLAHLEGQLERLRDDASEHRERERVLQRDLRQARRKLAQVESSTSFRLGHAIVRSARSPSSATRLPKELARAVRGPAAPAALPPEEHAGATDEPAEDVPAERWRLIDSLTTSATAASVPSLAVVGTPRLVEVLGRHAAVTSLLPHDGELLLDRLRPGALLVQASTMLRGSPWAGGGTSVAVERDLDLGRLLRAAAGRGVPTVWWWDAPAAALPLLRAVAASCDLTLSADGTLGPAWTPGADLPNVHLGASAGTAIVHLHAGGPRAPVGLVRDALHLAVDRAPTRLVVDLLDHPRLVDLVADTGVEVAVADPHDPTSAYRDAAVVLGSPFAPAPPGTDAVGAALAALVAGAQVVSGPNPALEALVGDLVTVVGTADELPAAIERALEAAAADPDDAVRWRTLRRLAATASPFAALQRLATHLGDHLDPSPARAVSVATELGADPDRAVGTILGQLARPQVVVVTDADAGRHDRAMAELEAAGVQVIAAAPGGPLPLTGLTSWLLRLPAGGELHPAHLQDLLYATELGPAPDVVGFADRLGPVGTLPATGTLLRAELARRLGGSGDDAARFRGLRSFGVPAGADGEVGS